MAAFEEAKKVSEDIVYLQELYFSGSVLTHSAYKTRLGTVGKRKEQLVEIEIAVTTRNRIIVEVGAVVMNHPYIQVLDVWELEKRKKRKTGG